MPTDRSSADDFEASFRTAFATRFPELYRYLDRLCGDAALASDVAQETFVRLFGRGEMPDDLRAWLVSVAHNLLRDEYRRNDRQLRLLASRVAVERIGEAPPEADAELLREERRAAVRALLDTLPERDRRLLLLRHAGYSYREIAEALGIAATSVGTLLARATAAFERALQGGDHASS